MPAACEAGFTLTIIGWLWLSHQVSHQCLPQQTRVKACHTLLQICVIQPDSAYVVNNGQCLPNLQRDSSHYAGRYANHWNCCTLRRMCHWLRWSMLGVDFQLANGHGSDRSVLQRLNIFGKLWQEWAKGVEVLLDQMSAEVVCKEVWEK